MPITRLAICVLIAIYSPPIFAQEKKTDTIYATSEGGKVFFNGKSVKSETLATALKKARAGDTVLILPGTYRGEMEFEKAGEEEAPIYIKGSMGLSVFACNKGAAKGGKPAWTFSASKWVVVQDLIFKDCWPEAVKIKNSEYISFKNVSFTSSYRAVSAEGSFTHHISMEDCLWLPDPSGQEAAKKPDLYDGSMFYGANLAGAVVFRRNTIKNAFHGVFLEGEAGKPQLIDEVVLDKNVLDNIRGKLLEFDKTSSYVNYPRRPFVVSHELTKNHLNLEFSELLKPAEYTVTLKSKIGLKDLPDCKAQKQSLVCGISGTPVGNDDLEQIQLPANLAAKGGGFVTTWGSSIDKIALKKVL